MRHECQKDDLMDPKLFVKRHFESISLLWKARKNYKDHEKITKIKVFYNVNWNFIDIIPWLFFS